MLQGGVYCNGSEGIEGCFPFLPCSSLRPDTTFAQGDQYRRAEILGIRDTKSGRHFYCNFDNFNKRLDEWVPVSRIDFDRDVEWPNPDKDKPKDAKGKKSTSQPSKKTVPSKKGQKRKLEPSVSTEGPQKRRREQSVTSDAPTPHPWTGTCSTLLTFLIRSCSQANQLVRLRRIAGTNTEHCERGRKRCVTAGNPWCGACRTRRGC